MDPVNKATALERLDGDEELYLEIVQVFCADTPGQVQKLKEAIDAGDGPVAQRQAHSIKSASGNIGADTLRAIAFRMETAAKEGGAANAAPIFPELKTEFDQVMTFLEKAK